MKNLKERSCLEKWGAVAASLTAILTLIFLLFPHLKPKPKSPSDDSLSVVPARRASVPGDVILGTWEQFIFVTKTDLRSGGKFQVSNVNGVYVMSAVSQLDDSRSIHTIGLSQVQSNGSKWSFISNQGNGRIVHFALKKVSHNVFEGCASIGGQIIQCDRWIRIVGP